VAIDPAATGFLSVGHVQTEGLDAIATACGRNERPAKLQARIS
jgi:hypothetical protein